MSLHELLDKIKPKTKPGKAADDDSETIEFDEKGQVVGESTLFRKVFLSLVIILISLFSFGMGKLSSMGEKGEVKIEYEEILEAERQTANAASSLDSVGVVYTSKNGSKYHYPHCSGAKNIKDENKITFPTPLAAEKAGYALAANCSPKTK